MTQRARNAASWILSFLVSGIFLYFSLRGVDWARFWQTLLGAEWRYILASMGIMSGTYFLRSVRWRILLNPGERLGLGTVFWANMAGYLGNNILPARAGEVLRSVLISSRSAMSSTYVLTTAVGERLMDAIALVLGASLVLLTVNPKPAWMEGASRTGAIIAGAGAMAIMVLPHTGTLVETLLGRIPMPAGMRPRLLHFAEQILMGVRAFHDWGRFAGFVFLTLVIWTVDSYSAVVMARGLGLHLTLKVALLLFTGMGLGSALPSTPGYVGIYQYVAITILTPFGVLRDAALAYSLLLQVAGYAVVILFGLPGLYRLQGGSLRLLQSRSS